MQPGDIVRIKPSEKLIPPWRDYAERGTRMRVRGIDPRREGGAVDVQPVDHSGRTFRHHWFDENDLVPLAHDVELVNEAIRRLRGG